MKRLIDSNKQINFKNWITQHDPKTKWDFDNPEKLRDQFVKVIKESGDIDLKTVFSMMFIDNNPPFSVDQNVRFLSKKY